MILKPWFKILLLSLLLVIFVIGNWFYSSRILDSTIVMASFALIIIGVAISRGFKQGFTEDVKSK